jgi:RNA polymerase sigma factor (sigma-70 family)
MNKPLHQDQLSFVAPYINNSATESSHIQACKDKPLGSHSIDALFRDHWLDVCRLLHKSYGSGPPEPEDVAQEAFSQFAQMKDTTEVKNPKAYIMKIAVNITLKSIGKLCKVRGFIAEQLSLEEEQLSQICPETILQSEQRISAMQKGINKLTAKQRDVLMFVRIKGQTYAQISAQTGWSIADICRQLNEAMAILESIDQQVQGINFSVEDTNNIPDFSLPNNNTNKWKS